MNLLATRDTRWMTQCEAALLAEGVPMRWTRASDRNGAYLDVPTSEAERTSAILSHLLAEEIARYDTREVPAVRGPLLLQPAFATALCLAISTLVFFWVTGPGQAGSLWHEKGALWVEAFWAGDWWRVVTAASLHADAAHALGNAGFFLVLGWAAAERFGSGLAVLLWLLCAEAGFAASLLFSDTTLTVGASGGLFGLLGAAAGHAARHRHGSDLVKRGLLRSLGAAVLLLAYAAFSPRANIEAHVGGFLAGLLLGAMAPRLPVGRVVQVGGGLACLAALGGSWAAALWVCWRPCAVSFSMELK